MPTIWTHDRANLISPSVARHVGKGGEGRVCVCGGGYTIASHPRVFAGAGSSSPVSLDPDPSAAEKKQQGPGGFVVSLKKQASRWDVAELLSPLNVGFGGVEGVNRGAAPGAVPPRTYCTRQFVGDDLITLRRSSDADIYVPLSQCAG